ncbi:substrate-binding periplasmic protein [Neptunicella marina]|uniref:Transporter substrate-binding domain-containing protein n=1 Tax=Neptunicella marina TaxID=2125989 RepID=A0A8J6M0A2_9ALTE|nr:ABC transporter substrate-binding protein [Neptunicella marina]MBC3764483.1 transporter substrate-binding domain-containing protein [Neptunicella marina]
MQQFNPLYLLSAAILFFSVAAHCASGSASQQNVPPLLLLTEHSPPGEYLDENGQATGATVQLIKLIMQRLDENGRFSIQPWARSLAIAQTSQNTVLFETSRTEAREKQFNWVGPLKHYDAALYGRDDILPANLSQQQINQGFIACAARGSFLASQLTDHGFIEGKNLVLTTNDDQCAPMLLQGRIDLTPLNERAQQQVTQRLPDHVNLVEVMHFPANELYLAFSKDIPRERLERWQLALEQTYLDGSMRKLYEPVYREQTIAFLEQFAQQQERIRQTK